MDVKRTPITAFYTALGKEMVAGVPFGKRAPQIRSLPRILGLSTSATAIPRRTHTAVIHTITATRISSGDGCTEGGNKNSGTLGTRIPQTLRAGRIQGSKQIHSLLPRKQIQNFS